jgi:hypothetical protein
MAKYGHIAGITSMPRPIVTMILILCVVVRLNFGYLLGG